MSFINNFNIIFLHFNFTYALENINVYFLFTNFQLSTFAKCFIEEK